MTNKKTKIPQSRARGTGVITLGEMKKVQIHPAGYRTFMISDEYYNTGRPYRLPVPEMIIWDGGTETGAVFFCPFPNDRYRTVQADLPCYPLFLYNVNTYGGVCSVSYHQTPGYAHGQPYVQRILMTSFNGHLYIGPENWPKEFTAFVKGYHNVRYDELEELTPDEVKAWSWDRVGHTYTVGDVVRAADGDGRLMSSRNGRVAMRPQW